MGKIGFFLVRFIGAQLLASKRLVGGGVGRAQLSRALDRRSRRCYSTWGKAAVIVGGGSRVIVRGSAGPAGVLPLYLGRQSPGPATR